MFMDLHLLIIQLYLHTVGFCVDCVTLSPTSVDIWENSDVTLFCTNNAQYFKAAGWHINDKIVAMERNEDICKAYGFLKNETIYSYSCPDNNTFSVTIKKISREWHDRTLRCSDTDLNESNDVMIFVKVPTQTATIYPKENVFTTMENDTHVFVRCISNQCRPEPTFLWYKDHNTNSSEDDILLWEDLPDSPLSNMTENFTSTFNYTLNRTLNDWYIFCVANNSLADKIISDKILLDITYPPDRPPSIDKLEPEGEFRVTVIEGNYATLTCSVTGGNPPPQLEWSKSGNEMQTITGSTVTKTLSWRASRVDEDILTCTSIYLYENQTTSVNITVLFPPDKPTITMRSWSGELFKLSKAIDVIEQKPFTISCSAISNPPVSKYSWFGLLDKKNSSLYNGGANRSHTEATCHVFNQMKKSNSNQIVTGTNSTSLKLNVMYPPEINMKNGEQKTIQEGDHFIYSCNVTHGNPNATKVEWIWADKTWDGQQLILNNVPRNQTGVYQCCAHNWISSSDGNKTVGNVCANIQLHVEYKAKVLNLSVNKHDAPANITISENDTLNISCELEGNPIPQADLKFQMAIFIRNKLDEEKKIIPSVQTSSNLSLTTTFYAKCTDAGQYTCTGRNTLYSGLETVSKRSIALFVKCKPRMSPFHELSTEVYSAMSHDVTLSFIALAYPLPSESGYTWYKTSLDGISTAINISSSYRITITSLGLQSNLSIRNVTQSDYGLYKVKVENDVGIFEHTFNLATEDSREDPKLLIATVGGAAGGVLVLLVSFVAVVKICKSSQRSSSYSRRDPRDADDPHANQTVSQDDTIHSPLNGGNRNLYGELQNADGANYSMLDAGCSNMYEEIQNAGALCEYENLQLAPIKETLQD